MKCDAHHTDVDDQRTGSDLMPFWKFDRSRTGSPAGSTSPRQVEHGGEHRPHLDPGEVGAEAEVRAVAEGEVLVGGAGGIEGVGVGERPSGSRLAEENKTITLSPARIFVPASSVSTVGRPAEVHDRRPPPQHLLHRRRDERRGRRAAGAGRRGAAISATIPPGMPLRSVSLPATENSQNRFSNSSRRPVHPRRRRGS